MADNYVDRVHNAGGDGTRFIIRRAVEISAGVFAEVVVMADAAGNPVGSTGVGHGVKTVAVAGTDEALAASTPAKWVTIQAQTDNTNKVAIGAAGVDATVATGTGIALDPGDVYTLPVDNLADIFVDALVSGEGVRYTYGT